MTLFWISVAGLMALAIAFIILPLLRKREYPTISADELNLSVFKQQVEELDNDLSVGILDQARYEAARKDLEKELLTDVNGTKAQPATANTRSGRWVMSVALVIPLMSMGIYQVLGSPGIIPQLAAASTGDTGKGASPHGQASATENLPPMEELVKKLAAKMESQPNNMEGWLMLGRSYMAMNQPGQAIAAYERGMQVNPENVTLLLAYAEALAQSSGNDFTGKATALVEKAYQLDQKDPNTLWMMGIVAYQKKDFQGAIGHWEQAKGLLGPEHKDLNAVDNAIDDARNQLGLGPQLPSIVQTKDQPQPVAGGDDHAIELIIKLDPNLAAKANPDDMVFIYAKALSGPPMPLAAVRKQVRDLPITVRLDDSMAMMPEMKLSAFPEVAVGARVSLSGNPIAKSGDLEGEIKPVKPGQSGPVMVIIDSIHP
jgi:cytochrome c-type biogenesis protein CcmH